MSYAKNDSRVWLGIAVGAALLAQLADRYFGWNVLPDAWGSLGLAGGNAGLLAIWAVGHCDGMDGPVVTLARKALESGNVNLVLPWVAKQDEDEIRRTFEHTVAVRKLGPEAQALADRHFFESLVRIHRAGEGEAYTMNHSLTIYLMGPDGRFRSALGHDLGPANSARIIEQAMTQG